MRQTIKTKTATIRATKIKMATIAAALTIFSVLPYAMGSNLSHARMPNAAEERASFDMPAAAPVAFLALSRELNAETERISLSAVAPEAYFVHSREFNATVERAGFELPTTAAVTFSTPPVQPHANAHLIDTDTPSPVPAAFYGLPRQLEGNVERISFDTPSLAPMAFMRFCLRYQQDCEVRRMGFRPRPIALTEMRRAELVKVNRDVNRAIRPQENINGVMAEEWLLSPRKGDCNDYAVTKRHELLARGWPSHSLLLAEVVVPSGEHHLVLVVRTREDDVVLDNLNWNVRSVSQIRYQWVRAQQTKNPKFWSTISVKTVTQVASADR